MSPAQPTHGVRFELQSVARALDDVPHAHKVEPRPGGRVAPLVFALCALLLLMAFVGWLLVG